MFILLQMDFFIRILHDLDNHFPRKLPTFVVRWSRTYDYSFLHFLLLLITILIVKLGVISSVNKLSVYEKIPSPRKCHRKKMTLSWFLKVGCTRMFVLLQMDFFIRILHDLDNHFTRKLPTFIVRWSRTLRETWCTLLAFKPDYIKCI